MSKVSILFLFIILILQVLGKDSEPKCNSSNDCLSNHICKNNKCVHRGFFPPNFSQIIEIFFMCGLSSASNAAGVGGGAIYSALLMFVENFEAKIAFPISSFSIFICSVITFILGVKNKMKNPSIRFIDYDLVLVFCPALLLGTKIGVILNSVFPALLLICFLVVSLSFSSFKTYKNALKAMKNEKELINNENRTIKEDAIKSFEKEEIIKIDENYNSPISSKVTCFKSIYDEEEIDLFYGDNAPIRLDRVKWVIFLLIIMILDQLLEGSNKLNSIIDIEKCSTYFWGIFILFISFCLGFTKLFYIRVKDDANSTGKINLIEQVNKNEFQITSPEVEGKINKIISFCFLAGTVSGMLGIGGGIFMAPLMLELGINTQVATSTSNVFLMFTSFSSTCLYLLAGNLVFSYALMFGILCGLSSFFGGSALTNYVKRTKKNSVLIWTLFTVSVLSLVILPINAIRHAIYDISIGKNILKFNSFC